MHPGTALRLHGHQLRQASRWQRCPVALQRRASRRDRAHLRRRSVLVPPGILRELRRDLVTGAPVEPTEYKALNPQGKAVLKAAEYLPPHELPSEDYPYQLITGRTLYHFHTRTKTSRAPQLQAAAPEVWVEASTMDAEREGWAEGDLLRVSTPRGDVTARLRISGIRERVLFLPFHYGYWDTEDGAAPGDTGRAANELTITDWDPASKQPIFKTGAAAATRIGDCGG